MEIPAVHFKYFESPEKYGYFLENEAVCDICETETRCFDTSAFIGEDTIDAICPECLANGRLKDLDIVTCQGDTNELKRQLLTLHPVLTAAEINGMVREKTDELEKTTPPVITWQDWEWPAVEGDYCVFIGYGSKPLYNRLSADNDGETLFGNSIYYAQEDEADPVELWEESMPDKEIKNNSDAERMSVLFYVFKSLHSDTIITLWDLD